MSRIGFRRAPLGAIAFAMAVVHSSPVSAQMVGEGTEEFKYVGSNRARVPIPDQLRSPEGPWMDGWFADVGGPLWYSPEKYEFVTGDTVAFVEFIFLQDNSSHVLRRVENVVEATIRCGGSAFRSAGLSGNQQVTAI